MRPLSRTFPCRCGLLLPALPPRIVCPGCNSAYIHDDRTGRWFPTFAWPTWTHVSVVACLTLAGWLLIGRQAWPPALVLFLIGISILLWDRTRQLNLYATLPSGPKRWWHGWERLTARLDLILLVLLLGAPIGLLLGWLVWRAFAG